MMAQEPQIQNLGWIQHFNTFYTAHRNITSVGSLKKVINKKVKTCIRNAWGGWTLSLPLCKGQAASQPCQPVALLSPHLPRSRQRKSVLDNWINIHTTSSNIATKRHKNTSMHSVFIKHSKLAVFFVQFSRFGASSAVATELMSTGICKPTTSHGSSS